MRQPQFWLSLTALMATSLTACVADTDGLDPNALNTASWPFRCEPEADRVIGPYMSFSESSGCNQCTCADCGMEICPGECTAVLCPGAAPQGSPYPRCSNNADCDTSQAGGSSGVCLFDAGCEGSLGYCHSTQSRCSPVPSPATPPFDETSTYCGCDGVSYSSTCPTVPYRNSGPCE